MVPVTMKAVGELCVCQTVRGWSHPTKALLQALCRMLAQRSSFLVTQVLHFEGNENLVHTSAVECKGRNTVLLVDDNLWKLSLYKQEKPQSCGDIAATDSGAWVTIWTYFHCTKHLGASGADSPISCAILMASVTTHPHFLVKMLHLVPLWFSLHELCFHIYICFWLFFLLFIWLFMWKSELQGVGKTERETFHP